MEWIEQLFKPIDLKGFSVEIKENDKVVFYPSTQAIEEALEKSMA